MIKYVNIKLYKDLRLLKEYNNIKSVCTKDSYVFKLDEVKTSLNDNYFIRETEEYKFQLDLIEKKATYLLKENNFLFDIDVEELTINKENNKITLEYKLNSDEEKLKLIIEG